MAYIVEIKVGAFDGELMELLAPVVYWVEIFIKKTRSFIKLSFFL